MINFDIISSDKKEDKNAVVRGFMKLREQDFFVDIFKHEWIVWMDCGNHFRNKLVVGYLLGKLATENIKGTFLISFFFILNNY